jgi:hypothetical protein
MLLGRYRLGVAGAMLARSLFALAALLVTIASSLTIARKLSPADYAAYQTLTKRAVWIASLPTYLFADWIYRYAAQMVAGTWEALRLIALATFSWGALVGTASALTLGVRGAGFLSASAALVGLLAVYNLYRVAFSAVRPVRIAVMQLFYRTLYALLVVVLVYLLRMGFGGAALAAIAASLAAVAAFEHAARRARPPPGRPAVVVGEWVRHLRPQVLLTLSGLLRGFDAFIVVWLSGSLAAAGFFAAGVASSMVRETLAWGMGYVSAAMLRGVEGGFARGFTLSASLAAPALAFVIAYPEHVVGLVNPRYMWAAPTAAVLAVAAYLGVYEAYVANLVSGLARGRAVEATPLLERMRARMLAVDAAYVAALAAAMLLVGGGGAGGAALAWAAILAAASAARSVALLGLLRGEARGEALRPLPPVTASLLLAVGVSLLFKPLEPPVEQRFFAELEAVTPFALLTLAASLAAVAAAPWNRSLLRGLARRALRILLTR